MRQSKNKKYTELDILLQNFDWKSYLDNNKDLIGLIKTEEIAKHHFKNYRYKEGRLCFSKATQNYNSIFKIQVPIIQIDSDKDTIIYYSKTNYDLLFQRPHQFMRFFDKTFNKIFIGTTDKIQYEEKYNLWIVPYEKRTEIYNIVDNNIITYFTDTRLYNDISCLKGQKLYDLIDAPIDEFSVWKPNLEKSVKMANYVIYSHPDLIKYLNEIDNSKPYYYISNACDYEHFSKAKIRIGNRPVDFPNTEKQILGYYGAFSEWLDYDLIQKYADENLYHIVMIGGIPNCPMYNIRYKHKNITWLDHKPYDELPYYLSWFDICFLPFKDCKLTKYVNPCKLWEYMASEKEIIKTNVNIECSNIIKYEDECAKIICLFKFTETIISSIQNYNIMNELNFDYNIKLSF